jgi:hypothetical protein
MLSSAYAQGVFWNAGVASTLNQLSSAWNHLRREFQRDIPRSTEATTKAEFLEQLEARMNVWRSLAQGSSSYSILNHSVIIHPAEPPSRSSPREVVDNEDLSSLSTNYKRFSIQCINSYSHPTQLRPRTISIQDSSIDISKVSHNGTQRGFSSFASA